MSYKDRNECVLIWSDGRDRRETTPASQKTHSLLCEARGGRFSYPSMKRDEAPDLQRGRNIETRSCLDFIERKKWKGRVSDRIELEPIADQVQSGRDTNGLPKARPRWLTFRSSTKGASHVDQPSSGGGLRPSTTAALLPSASRRLSLPMELRG